MGITSDRVREVGLLDEVVREPLGGGHRDYKTTAMNLKEVLRRHLKDLGNDSIERMLEKRYQRLMAYGAFIEELPPKSKAKVKN